MKFNKISIYKYQKLAKVKLLIISKLQVLKFGQFKKNDDLCNR